MSNNLTMPTKVIWLVWIILCGFQPFFLYAQNNPTTWSLEKCLEYAIENNIQLQQTELQVQTAKINEAQSRENIYPNLTGSAGYGLNIGRTVDPTTNQFSTEALQSSQYSLSSNFLVYNGHRLKYTIDQRELENQLAQLEVKDYKNNLQLTLLTAYLQILLSEDQLVVLKQQAQLTVEQLEQNRKLVKAGIMAEGDLLEIEAQIANDKLSQVNAQNTIKSAYLNLAQILDYYETIKIVTPTKVPEPSKAELEALNVVQTYILALETQPNIQSADLRTVIAQKQLQIAEGAKYPTISLGANLNTRHSSFARTIEPIGLNLIPSERFFTPEGQAILEYTPDFSIKKTPLFRQLWDNLGGSIGINVSIPIYNNRQLRNNVILSHLNIENTKYATALAKNNLRKNIEQAYLDANAAIEKYENTKLTISSLQKSLANTKKRVDAGLVNNLTYFTAKNRLTIAQLNLTTAKYEAFFKLKVLTYYQGKPLKLD